MSRCADLHIHTHFSDSTSSPEEVIQHAVQNGVDCISITDHDIIDGIDPTIAIAQKHNIEVIPGIEISSSLNKKDIHILGYGIDHHNVDFVSRLKKMLNTRRERMIEMIAKLKGLGIDGIELEEVTSLTEADAVGRVHLAQVLVSKGVVKNMKAAFDKYLADDRPACVSKFQQTPEEAIDMIAKAGGVSVLAHPMATRVDELIPRFVRAGLGGLEVFYPTASSTMTRFYEGLAKKHNILKTGGSDAHGSAKRHTYVGKVKIDYEYVEALKDKIAEVRAKV